MIGFLETHETQMNFLECKAYTKLHAKTFYFASHVLPPRKRMAAYAVYAFCRYADNIVDTTITPGAANTASARLTGLRDQIRYLYSFSPMMDRKLIGLRETVFTYRIPQEYFLDLLRGVEMDLTKNRYASFEELQDYCYCVASVVGLIMAHIFGAENDDALQHAITLGTAMQLTNILRDVGEDYRLGRIYLPADELARFGCSEKEIAHAMLTDNFVDLMKFQIDRARRYYAEAESGIPMITEAGSRFCARMMSATYARILDAIEENGHDVFTRRAYVSLPSKMRAALSCLLPSRQTAWIEEIPGPRRAAHHDAERTETILVPGAR